MIVRRDATHRHVRRWQVLGIAALAAAVPAVAVAAPPSVTGLAALGRSHEVAHSVVAGPPAGSRPGAAPAAATSATDLALELQKLLGQHAVLAAELMRSRIRNDPDLAQAANAAV